MLIPEKIDHFESNGEKILHFKFKNDSDINEMYVLHSLFTNYHLKNISGELDFLVIAPNKGIFAIEVKHRGVARKDGIWQFKNRFGAVTNKTKGPFAQVDGTMNSIRKYVLDKVKDNEGLHSRLSKILWGSGVAFTSMDESPDFGTEGHSWQVLTRRGLSNPISNYIETISQGWHSYNKEKYWYDIDLSRPSEKDCKIVLDILRGNFEVDYSEINKILDNDNIIEEFTEEQFNLLDFANYNSRCLIEGDAGTGKTLMALELMQRRIKNGENVILFCFNKQLGNKLNKYAEIITKDKSGKYFSGSLHSFLVNNTNIEYPQNEDEFDIFYNESLPFEFILQNEEIYEADKFDYLIIDEAQDLITPYYLEVFNTVLKGGLKNGKWCLLGDFSNQSIYKSDPFLMKDILNEEYSFTKFPPLKINCRNTIRIAKQNSLLTGVKSPEFTSRAIEGDQISTRFTTISNAENEVESILEQLINNDIPLEKITLLSHKKIDNTFLKASGYIKELKRKGLEITTIQSFKGLENTIIILFDFDEISSKESQNLLYVGISRARQKLFIVLNKTLEKSYQKLIQTNFNKI